MKRLIIMVAIAVLMFSVIAVPQSQVGVKDYHPIKWQQAYCPTDGNVDFSVIGHATTPTADTSAIYVMSPFSELWLRILPDDADAATNTDSIATYVVIQVRDKDHINTGMTYDGWRRIDSVLCAITDTLYGVYYEATKIPAGATHIRTIVAATSDADRGGATEYPHWIGFKQ